MTTYDKINVTHPDYSYSMELQSNDIPIHEKVFDSVLVTHPIDDEGFISFMRACSLSIKNEAEKGNPLVTFTGTKDVKTLSLRYSK